MADAPVRSHAVTPLSDVEREFSRPLTCPLCHTVHSSLPAEALEAGSWQCSRCGQHWDAARLAHDAAYAGWVVEHETGR